jgi:hypothetical protein
MHFTQAKIQSLKPNGKKQWIADDEIKGLRLYIGPTGVKVWYFVRRDVNSKVVYRKIANISDLTVTQAREQAQILGGKIAKGESVRKEQPTEKLTLGSYLENTYFPLMCDELKSAKETKRKITANFKEFFKKPIEELNADAFDKWIKQRIESGAKAATVNKIVSALKAALN